MNFVVSKSHFNMCFPQSGLDGNTAGSVKEEPARPGWVYGPCVKACAFSASA